VCKDILVLAQSYASEQGLICRFCHSRDDMDGADPVAQAGGWLAELHAWLRKVALAQSDAMRRRDRLLP
jgi:hypothetical protein